VGETVCRSKSNLSFKALNYLTLAQWLSRFLRKVRKFKMDKKGDRLVFNETQRLKPKAQGQSQSNLIQSESLSRFSEWIVAPDSIFKSKTDLRNKKLES
jgi:hypothetical protein